LSPEKSQKIGSGIAALNSGVSEEEKLLDLARAEVANIGIAEFARQLQIDPSNLSKVVDSKRNLSRELAAKLDGYFRNFPAS
jgi:plasmid maintenance system antidote protein VapI